MVIYNIVKITKYNNLQNKIMNIYKMFKLLNKIIKIFKYFKINCYNLDKKQIKIKFLKKFYKLNLIFNLKNIR